MSAIIPNFTSFPTPNPNPNPIPIPIQSHTDASQSPSSPHSIDGSAADPTQYQHVDVTMNETTNAVVTATQPVNILPFHCEVCNISCNTKDVLETHKQGKKHVKSVKKLSESSANGQNMVPPPVASETLVGELIDSSVGEPKMVPVPPPIASENIVGELENKTHRLLQNGATAETLVYCDICKVVCNNQEVFKAHVAGKKHSAKSIVQQASTNGVFDAASDSSGGLQKKPDTFPCEICNITCTGNELLKKHIAGKKHLKKLKELGQLPVPPLTPFTSQDTSPTKPVANPESIEVKTMNLDGAEPSNLPSTSIASQDAPPTKPVVNPETNEGKTVNLHGVKSVCELCGVFCDTDEMLKIHMSGKKHRKNVEKSEKLIGPNPAVTTEPAETPKMIGPLQEDGKMVTSDAPKTKRKKSGSDDDVETKKQRILQSGTALDSVQMCNLCNVVCNSPKAFIDHLAGQKHVAMAVKHAETQAGATGQES